MKLHPHQEKILNPEQEKAVHFGKGSLLIIAGAGTGKTTVVTERIKHLVTSGLAKPAEILALTFTEKAAREMEERVDLAMPYGYTQMWISTFHSFCDRILRQEAVHIGLSPNYRLLSDTEATLLARRNLFEFDLDYFRPLGNPNKFIAGMLQHFSRLKDEDTTPDQYHDWVKSQISNLKSQKEKSEDLRLEIKKHEELAKAYKFYEELKTKENVTDFADLIANALILFRTRKNILNFYQKQFKFILVDEFQDTNIAQNELIQLLAGKRQNITAVADDDQSIYKFRGAAVSNVLAFRKHFHGSKLIILSKNYRSTQEILNASYRLIQYNNPDRLEVKEKVNKKLVAIRKIKGEPIIFLKADRVENEAEIVAKEIKKLVNERNKSRDEDFFTETRENSSSNSDGLLSDTLNWKDFAILVRANAHAEPFVRAFTRHGIPFQFLGPGQLFRQPEIKELIAYLQMLVNFADDAAFFKVLSMEYFDLSIRDLIAIANLAKKQLLSFFEVSEVVTGIRTAPEVRLPAIEETTRGKLKKIVEMICRHIKLLTKETAGQILYFFLEDTGMIKSILDYSFPLDEKKAINITKFFNKLKTYEAEHQDASVQTVLDWITLAMELGESPLAADTDWTENDAVNILTVHGSKGLEFPVVFLANLVSQRFPTIERREQIPIPEELIKEDLPVGDYHEEEERRLFYVGMTRARDRLYMTAANFYGEGRREKKISPFVQEALGKNLIAKHDTTISSQLSLLEWKKTEMDRQPDKKSGPRVTYLSYSQIETFRLCPLHYKLRYILGIPTPPSPALSFGASVHAALKDFYLLVKQGKRTDRETLIKLLGKNWQREGYNNLRYEEKMRTRGENYLTDFYRKSFDPRVKPLLLEQPFMIPVAGERKFIKIGGKIDRVDKIGKDRIEIIDYKTGKLPSRREIDTSLQLSIYALAATQMQEPPFGRPLEDITLSFYFFDVQEKVTTTRSLAQLEAEKTRIMSVAEEIERSDFRCSGNDICRSCEYKLYCGTYETR